jgi:hypothetical protein
MKRLEYVLLALILTVVGFVATQAVSASRLTATSEAAVLEPAARPAPRRAAARTARTSRAGKAAVANRLTIPAPARDVADVRRRLRQGEKGTYISEVLLQRDSALARWPERLIEPLKVWVADGSGTPDWDASYIDRVREAFTEWAALGIPVRFTFVVDSAEADIHVSWTDQFNEPISGKTLWARDRNWWIVSSSITLALHHNGGEPLDGDSIRAIALHEVGHLLGLDHTTESTNIMTARVRVRSLSEADRATVRLLYSLPPGSVRGG